MVSVTYTDDLTLGCATQGLTHWNDLHKRIMHWNTINIEPTKQIFQNMSENAINGFCW